MSSPNLESLTNELSKFGAHLKRSFAETETPKDPHGIPNRPLMDTQMEPLMEPLIDPQTDPWMECMTPERIY